METFTRNRLIAGILLPLTVVYAQNNGADIASSIYPDSSTSSTATSSASSAPSNTNDNSTDDRNTDTGGLVHYYFVFLALIVILAFLGSYLIYRRKRKAASTAIIYHHGQHGALQQDFGVWDPSRARRRYWQGRWRSTEETHRDEGLNENGEAPPPYMPKGQQPEDVEAGHGVAGGAPAVPLQTLSRDQAGLKPPGYDVAVNGHYGGRAGDGDTDGHPGTSIGGGPQQPAGAAPQYR